jgi:hypothetical protein
MINLPTEGEETMEQKKEVYKPISNEFENRKSRAASLKKNTQIQSRCALFTSEFACPSWTIGNRQPFLLFLSGRHVLEQLAIQSLDFQTIQRSELGLPVAAVGLAYFAPPAIAD